MTGVGCFSLSYYWTWILFFWSSLLHHPRNWQVWPKLFVAIPLICIHPLHSFLSIYPIIPLCCFSFNAQIPPMGCSLNCLLSPCQNRTRWDGPHNGTRIPSEDSPAHTIRSIESPSTTCSAPSHRVLEVVVSRSGSHGPEDQQAMDYGGGVLAPASEPQEQILNPTHSSLWRPRS